MTEVDVVLPEGVAEPKSKLLAKTSAAPVSAKSVATAKVASDDDDDNNSNNSNNSNSRSEDLQQDDLQKTNSKRDVEQEPETKQLKQANKLKVVDAVIDAKLPLDSNSNTNSNSNSNDDCKIDGDAKQVTVEESMDVDETTEEDEGDSQITSSTENGNSKDPKLVDGDEGAEDEEEEEEVTTNGDHEDTEEDHEKIGSTAENSCDAEDPLGAATQPVAEQQEQVDELVTEKKNSDEVDDLEEEEGSQESGTAKTVTDSEAEAIHTEEEEEEGVVESKKKETPLNGFIQSPEAKGAAKRAPKAAAADAANKANGQASTAEATKCNDITGHDNDEDDDAGGVVNLDEDSDEDEVMPEAPPATAAAAAKPSKAAAPSKAKSMPQAAVAVAAASSGGESSDDAVVIPSDSESETGQMAVVTPQQTTSKKMSPVVKVTPAAAAPPPPPVQDDDDDDDDCVVIEDDTPPSISPSDQGVNKRKSDLDDLQSNSKRQRSSTPSTNMVNMGTGIGLGQLTIKDARTLMPHEAGPTAGAAVYPVTITNAVTGVATNLGNAPPKLVPMSTGISGTGLGATVQLNPPTLSLTAAGLPSMTNNANLLPGLTDDMFVLEAPSFIVPYIYEKPPNDNIREVIRAIETKYALSPEDLAVADKLDEFDMMTEQNKEDKLNADAQGKKKKKRGDDESWSEQSDEDDDEDDDDDSESGVRTKVLIKEANDDLTALKGAIKPAAALAASGGVTSNVAAKPGQENYFESPLGKFFMDIGVGLVQEYVQADLLRLQKRKMRKSLTRDPKDFEMAINALSGNLQASKTKNAPFKFTMKRCEFCNFKSESALSMANHYETPHMNGVLYKCNFCTFEIRNATEIVYHMEAVHNIKARLIKPLPYHQCPNCGFEDNGKAKLARHQPVCAKKFRPELNLAPPNDWEAPAKIPRIKPRHGLVGTATAYQAMAAQAAAQKVALANIQQQQAAAQARNLQAAALAAQNAAKMRQRAPQMPKAMPNANNMVRNPAPVRGTIGNNAALSLPNSYQLAAGQLVQQASKKPIAGQPSISITPLPRQSAIGSNAAAASSSKQPTAAAPGMKPGQSPSGGNNKAQFVICEICDGYIKDLEQLRNHMQWMHKVKIHPKMIYNRPPLNCQKCQFRFFTDQGLERHLLGSHGLVTSSMQEAANKGKDAGRCPVCGRMYQWKLLNHVSRDHHMTLKPAHLSYKCTVCTATFGMYKQFETHVYTAHSTVARKAMDSKKNSAQSQSSSSSGGGGGAGLSRNSLGAANDSLLKPLKINDEITIIPQPASKPRITNMESHVID
ncbi:uncharacterized protein LOC6558500 [Drosophila grimshawi]|uniref:MOG interacting and ectopic P-granules protein 1 n=1 Tax=Drosophila grimshawi TaxID=7222 RepID=B4IZD0_DROGR|nr:uncharacterized protein LOC6558500 [Drosophila grimshawi]EDV96685.1 GH16396 [Drosophila grimshawi]